MPNIETFQGESAIGAVAGLHDGVVRKGRAAKAGATRLRTPGLRVPGRTPARPDAPAPTGPAAIATAIAAPPATGPDATPGRSGRTGSPAPGLPAGPDGGADARGLLDTWHEDLDGLVAALPPGERTSRFSRIEHARAAYLAARVPDAMRPAQVAHHADFLAHEYAVALSFAQARAGEPGLTCNEWARRNPFAPGAPPAAVATVRAPADPVP